MRDTVAIIGAGPAGSALACFLQERGYRCIVYSNLKTIDLMVGESLISAVIPHLQRLGIEDEVAQISELKLGAGFRHGDGTRVDFRFPDFGARRPGRAYNIPRPAFDNLLRDHARARGITFVDEQAKLEPGTDGEREVQLSDASLAQAGLTRATQPAWIVDASGRARSVSRLLDIPARRGGRNDAAYFAHFSGFEAPTAFQGQVLLTALDQGWSWQIPLRDCLSVGVVVDAGIARQLGSSPRERLEAAIESSPLLRVEGARRQYLTDVATYANYQLISERGFGPGWVAVGDALGFVDPMLSPGVFMALEAAATLDHMVFRRSRIETAQLQAYYDTMQDWHRAWTTLINYFYNGQLLGMAEQRNNMMREGSANLFGKLAEKMVSGALAGMTTGYKTRSALSQGILRHSCDHMLKDQEVIDARRIRPGVFVGQN
ncbi:FAD-binding protein [Mangrovimicrobium sediminis]|uniref:FAD-binding protein n=1 Tax=Mangrovimicrobium sediminis TaxID=2562682 RepID=A0A4Z0LZX6_9GAMM|nr:tryptophan 7-halogenase [Haliea sp. SAOS-164]TGD72668.1 FAD-binding protein [Haliea sp. SAOS-164]